ncbi:MAG: VCBS repeat-containing protein [Bacteroidetes bacterium]|nr:VCBS repeat-containing protein [Bacteroidota bacterium]
MKTLSILILLTGLLLSCSKENHNTLFTALPKSKTGIDFRNLLKEEMPEFNITTYPYFYNGGGVAVGDLNNDSLPDIFFTGNMVKNRLFLNKGNFEFENITAQAHIAEKEGWCTGVTMADVNADGWLDIYICRSGLANPALRKNLLFINNHNLTFTESASAYGLDDSGYSTQASFFDYDKDGDLDMFLINQSSPEYSKGKMEFLPLRNKKNDPTLENKLFRNDNGKFINVTQWAGIESNVLSFSLGLSTADINQDGWPDIYITNDFKEPDYLYINQKDGTFINQLTPATNHISLYSMGVDVADYNNDLLPDIIVPDMFSEDNYAQKMHIGGDNFTQYNQLFSQGMFPQFMKNTLQKNNGDGTFSEIGQLAGVSNTDWSWSPLLADFDNDGKKDLFISNGYKRDNTELQFILYSMNQSLRQNNNNSLNVAEYISHMSGIYLPNYIYKNTGQDLFENKIKEWGLNQHTYSNGAAYADLDNDGDLDIIVNNIDDYAGVYQNNSEVLKNNFLKIRLQGEPKNADGIGSKIMAYASGETFYLEQTTVRGYQSSISSELHLGLGKHATLDSLRIIWPNRASQVLEQVKANQVLHLHIKNAQSNYVYPSRPSQYLTPSQEIAYTHRENFENDFLKQFLLPRIYSNTGPCLVKGDVNGDGVEDVFIGGNKNQASCIYLGGQEKFKKINIPVFEKELTKKVVDAVFFDADGDRDLDLYVAYGGYEYSLNDPLLQDHLYLNDGKGNFHLGTSLPQNFSNKNFVKAIDLDKDGDLDIFVGGGVEPGHYPVASPSKILINNGAGKFTDQSQTFFSNIQPLNIVSDVICIDLNQDGYTDLVTVGEWEPIRALLNNGKTLTDATASFFPFASKGWWNKMIAEDFDHDGDQDLVVGNFGLNTPLHATETQPMQLYYADLDKNGSVDPIITHYINGVSYPLVTRDDMIGQIPMLKKKFIDYQVYAKATIQDIIPPEQFASTPVLSAQTLRTIYLENKKNKFTVKELPIEAQYAPVHAMLATDVDKDGNLDLILAGNNRYNRIYLGSSDANHGQLLLGNGKGEFKYVPQYTSGLKVQGDVRSVVQLTNHIWFGINGKPVQSYTFVPAKKAGQN